MFQNNLFKAFIIAILPIIGYLGYDYYLDQRPVITIYADNGVTKVRPQEVENMVSLKLHGTLYENLISPQTVIKNPILLPDPEKPLDINSRAPIEERIEDLLANLSNEEKTYHDNDLTQETQNKSSKKVYETAQNRSNLNIIKINKKNSKVSNNIKHEDLRGYKIQLASVKSYEDAVLEGAKIKERFAKILKNAEITTEKVKYGDSFFYLVLAGSYNSISQAKAICKKLSYKQQSCILK